MDCHACMQTHTHTRAHLSTISAQGCLGPDSFDGHVHCATGVQGTHMHAHAHTHTRTDTHLQRRTSPTTAAIPRAWPVSGTRTPQRGARTRPERSSARRGRTSPAPLPQEGARSSLHRGKEGPTRVVALRNRQLHQEYRPINSDVIMLADKQNLGNTQARKEFSNAASRH